jgi:hypothetical protein
MGNRRFDPRHWPQTARTRWVAWRMRHAVSPLGPGIVADQDGNERIEAGEIGFIDVPSRRMRRAKRQLPAPDEES